MEWHIQSSERKHNFPSTKISTSYKLAFIMKEKLRHSCTNKNRENIYIGYLLHISYNKCTGSPLSWNEMTLENNSIPHEEIKNTAEGEYIGKYKRKNQRIFLCL